MKHFQLAGQAGQGVWPLTHAVQRQPELWEDKELQLLNGQGLETAIQCLPQVRSILMDLIRRVEAYRLEEARIHKLAPGSSLVLPVQLSGDTLSSYMVMLLAAPGIVIQAADEKTVLLTGDCWWLSRLTKFEILNNSPDECIFMLVIARNF